jgi:hypothetical protein
MKQLFLIALTITLFACKKNDSEPEQPFSLVGEWKTEKFWDVMFEDTAYEIYQFTTDTTCVRWYYGNSGFEYFKSYDKVRLNAGQIVFYDYFMNPTSREYLYLNNKTIYLKYQNWVKLDKVK